MKRNLFRIAAAVLVIMMLCAVSVGSASAAGADHILTFASAERALLTPAEVYAQNVNSTVSITTSTTVNYFGYDAVSAGAGSGFILSPDGYILTNYHVVDNAEKITVTMYNDDSYEAELIGCDASNDIAVIKIDASGLVPVTFGDSDKVIVGEEVVAIGNPLGELSFSLTRGVVSALDRDMTFSGKVRLKLIQTDCAINSGNSGGALFNMYGEVIGITNAKAAGSGFGAPVDNIAFAIPVNTVVGIVEQIMTKGEISSPYIGISINNVDEKLLAYGIPRGANVVEVTEDSPADEAGLQKNDIIVGADDTVISESDDLVHYIRSCAAGDEVVLKVYRQGENVELRVTVGENVKSALPETEEAKEAE
jgi:Trypsin-like serine proteases, typically periplasmic, contain C-terminal PDZ domain